MDQALRGLATWDLRDAIRLGVAVPAMNVAIDHDWARISPPGLTFHVHRIPIAAQLGHAIPYGEADAFVKEFEIFRDEGRLERAVRDIANLFEPDHIVYPLTSVTGWDGAAGADRLEDLIRSWSGGRNVTLGVRAIEKALQALELRRIAIIGPYPTVVLERVADFFREVGFDVLAVASVAADARPQEIARVPFERIRNAIRSVDSKDVDGLVQAGAALSLLTIVDEVERDLGKPMLALNPTALWAAARSAGIDARMDGAGRLWREA